MELPSEEGEMPVPLNSTYGHGHMIHHHDHHPLPPPPPSHNHIIIPSSGGGGGGPPISSSSTLDHDDGHGNIPSFKKMIRYRECLKNHAAAMGGNATDGCGEFMPSGEDGTLEALTCSACNCHRNFHRKEIEGEPSCDINSCSYHNTINVNSRMGRKVFVGHHKGGYLGPEHHALGYHHHAAGAALISSRPPHQMIMSYNMGGGGGGGVGVGSLPSDQSDEQDGGGGGAGVMVRPPHQLVKKRFRTKFTPEQKEKMLNFAEKVGWKIQKQEEAVVQHFCQEVGIKRRVLKVWMHNNKHNLAKKNLQSDPQNQV